MSFLYTNDSGVGTESARYVVAYDIASCNVLSKSGCGGKHLVGELACAAGMGCSLALIGLVTARCEQSGFGLLGTLEPWRTWHTPMNLRHDGRAHRYT